MDIIWNKYDWKIPAKIRDKILNKRLELINKNNENNLGKFDSGYLECLCDISQMLNDNCRKRQINANV